ncbi:MAG: hypothetical protein KDA71_06150 [Planctomycetales bacterium]|nr:hypothetical protein [Planctomycetales bacterium]
MKTWMLILALGLAMPVVDAAMADCTGGPNCGCHVQCPNCRCYCKLTVEKEKEKNYCWNVECKPICVPKVRFPWESCCKPKCAYVKHVNVLVKEEYECEHCKYKWEPICVPCATCSRGNCNGGCAAGGCATGGCAQGIPAMPTEPAMLPAAPAPAPPATPAPALDGPPQPPPLTLRNRIRNYFGDDATQVQPVSVSAQPRATVLR